MNGYSTFPKAPALLESHHQIVLCHIQNTCLRGLTPQQRCSQCILQSKSPGQDIDLNFLNEQLLYTDVFKKEKSTIITFIKF